MPSPEPLQPQQYYRIYNRGNSGEPLFREERNYRYFLKPYAHCHELPWIAFQSITRGPPTTRATAVPRWPCPLPATRPASGS